MIPPISPCGLAVDRLRSCYSTLCQFDPTGQADPVTIRWYFVEEETPTLEIGTPFRSANWDDWRAGARMLGEVEGAPRNWRNGSRVGDAAPLTSDDFAGTEEQWYNGIVPPWPETPVDSEGTPIACPRCSVEGRAFDCGYSGGYL